MTKGGLPQTDLDLLLEAESKLVEAVAEVELSSSFVYEILFFCGKRRQPPASYSISEW
jgi:hypothetical protein